MPYGPVVKFTGTIASGATLSSEINLSKSWTKVYLDPTGLASEVRVQAAASTGGTFRQVYHPPINSSTVGNNIFKIASAVSGGICEIPAGLQFIKIEATAAVANGATFTIVCAD